jgi:MYXO-CTERM domain-containing protein
MAEPSHTAPELSGSAAGSSLALVAGGLFALLGRRKRKTPAG